MTEYIKCISKSRTMKPCCYYPIGNSLLCHIHQYQAEYTAEMMMNLAPCSTCRKTFYFENGDKVCESCKIRAQKTREESRAKVVLCDKEGCEYKRSQENKYCKLHQLQIFIDETAESGKKVCYNHTRGCREQLDAEYTFSKCGPCLKKDREKDHAKRNQVKTSVESHMNTCTTCCQVRVANDFIGQTGTTKTCKSCRDSNKRQDAKRDKEHRLELSRVKEDTPAIKYIRCRKNARDKGIPFELEYETYFEIIQKPCFYCGIVSNYLETETLYKNGIDRKDSGGGYLYDNCVSCCKMCNYMKGSLQVTVFLMRIEHILVYNHLQSGELHPNAFANSNGLNYAGYRNGAKKRNLEFTITEEEFDNTIMKDCYICGKKPLPHKHTNGIDRYDNSIGYTIENIRPCCKECNFFKKDFAYNDIIHQCGLIYQQHNKTIAKTQVTDSLDAKTSEQESLIEIPNCSVVKREHSTNKIREQARIRKQRQIESLKEKYGEEAYKEMRAKQMAEYRNKKKNTV